MFAKVPAIDELAKKPVVLLLRLQFKVIVQV
jgi:hypothetical protein